MTKASANDWKTPLGYYERAITETTRMRKEFQVELQTLKELQVSQANMKAEFHATQIELQTLKAELQATQADSKVTIKRLENLLNEAQKVADFAHSEAKIAQDSVERLKTLLTEAQKSTDSAHSKAKTAQDTANTIHSEIKSVKSGIENGEIVAQKALMLRGKDDLHWMNFHMVDSVNHHWFQIWRSDNTWHDNIRIKAARFLRARDDTHWMGFNYTKEARSVEYDNFLVREGENIWNHTVRVGAAERLRR